MVAAILAALTVAYTWPLVLHVNSAVAHDRGDPLLVTWLLWWSTHHVPLTGAWWNAPAFYPSPGVFAFSETMLGLAPIAWPIIVLTRSPLLAYNAAFLLSYVLSGLGAYFLGWALTRRQDAAMLAALAFAFAPYRLSHAQHLQLLSAYWMPVAIASLHLYVEAERPRWAVLFAASWLLQALACGYYFFYLTLLTGLWLACLGRRDLTRRGLLVLAAAWLAAGLVIAPVLFGYEKIQQDYYGFARSPVEIVNYSADVAGLWSVAPESLAWSWLRGGAPSESQQFPGATAVLLTATALILALRRRRAEHREVVFYAGAAALMWLLSLGPRPALHGTPLGVPGPYAVLAALPGVNGMRVPARLWMVAVVCLSACAALALARIDSPRARRIVFALAAAGLLVDGWPSAIGVMAAPPVRVTRVKAAARLGLPIRTTETETMYGAIAQDRPVFNGYSGYTAPQHPALVDMLDARDSRILDRLAADDPIEVVVEWANDPDGSWRGWLDSYGAVRADGGEGWTAYVIPRTGAAAPAAVDGTRLRVASVTASANGHDIGAVLDGDLVSRWHTPQQQGNEIVTLDLGSPQRVRAVVMCLGGYPSQYPRMLSADVSIDGKTWQVAASGNPVLATYDAALRSPREVPVPIPIDRAGVRFIRLRQTQASASGWSIVELRVLQ
jgi:F5/8 type C domain-containing protein